MQADTTVAPTCIDIIYILHVYLSLCVITIYCKCVSTNKYCLLSIINHPHILHFYEWGISNGIISTTHFQPHFSSV